MNRRRRWARLDGEMLILNALAVGAMVFFVGPMLWLYLTSLKPPDQVFALPPVWIPQPPTLRAFVEVIAGEGNVPGVVPAALMNSIVVSLAATVLTIAVGIPAAYAFARYRFPASQTLFIGILVMRMTPGIMLITPVFLLFSALKLIDNKLSLIILYTAFMTPFTVWMLQSVFAEVPVEIEEAGRIDGCNLWQLMRYIVLPTAFAGVAATAILVFIMAWNEYLFALVLTRTSSAITMPVAITQLITFEEVIWLNIAAAGVIMTLPVFVFSLFVQRYIVRGITMGAVKA